MVRDEHVQKVEPGDTIVIESHSVGAARRTGEILEVIRTGIYEHYRVRWDDGHESVFYPRSGDATFRHRAAVEEPVLVHEP